jgi:two-component system NtrC family sensor kinase
MRLLGKIASAVLLGIIALLAIDGYFSVQREIDLFDRDMARDGILLGQTLRPLVADAWKTGGDAAAAGVIQEANRQEGELEIRWVRLDAPEVTGRSPRVAPAMLDSLTSENEISIKATEEVDGGYRYTYIGVPVASGRAAIELSESLSTLNSYTRSTIVRTVALVTTLIIVSWLILWALGVRFIGAPLKHLVEKTRRVGSGDFTGDVVVTGRDELAHLASALNDMCAALNDAQQTLRKETEARMEALEQLRHSERLAVLGRLSSGIAHELGTPLNVVAGRAHLIATEELAREDVVAFSKTIADQAHRMTDIIRQLLGFAHRRPERREPSDVAALASQIIDLLGPTAQKENVTLAIQKADGIPRVNIARSHVQQVLMNLVMNGIQAMPGGGRLTVATGVARSRHRGVSPGPERDYVTISVEDTGVGMSAEKLELIFEPFFTTKESGIGTGLGLSIAHGIAEEHDGWIDAESTPGRGSRFTVYLPVEASS